MGRRGSRRRHLLFFVLSLLLLLASIAAITAHSVDHTHCDRWGYRYSRPMCRRTLYDPFENNFSFSRIALDTLDRERHRQLGIIRYYTAITQCLQEDIQKHISSTQAFGPRPVVHASSAPSPLNQEDDGL